MRGVGVSARAALTCGCLVLVLVSVLAPVGGTQTHRDRLFGRGRQRRDLDLEGLPPEIREKIASSRVRTSTDTSNAAPNCWVEVDVPRRVGGVCRRIENMPACSVNDNLYINHPDCM